MTKTGENLIAGRGGNLAGNSSHHQPPARVLVVDDEPSALKLLCLILNTPAFHCTAANNGEEALVALHREHFDAVISDLCMPGIGGMEVLAEARRQDRHVAFVVTTGVDDVEVGVQVMRSGADDYLVKPLTERGSRRP
jgi:DNA-binding response OmpR family regulator